MLECTTAKSVICQDLVEVPMVRMNYEVSLNVRAKREIFLGLIYPEGGNFHELPVISANEVMQCVTFLFSSLRYGDLSTTYRHSPEY